MRVFLQSPDASGRIDGTVRANLLNFFHLVPNQNEADIAVVPISYYDNFEFNEQLYRINRPWICLDYLEYGSAWKAGTDTHVLGRNTANFSDISSPEWMKLDAFVRDHKPVVYFKRELLERERSEWLQPVEFPCYLPAWPAQSKEEFDKRPIEVFMSWGLSHACRQALHGEMFMRALENGITMISAWDQFDKFDYANHKRVWASVHSPHITRVDISTVVHNQSRAKISLSLPGNGYLCFRHTESCVNSIMCGWNDDIARSFDWRHGFNCLRLNPENMYGDLLEFVTRSDLHDIYIEGLLNLDKYRSSRYVSEYLVPKILQSI